MGKTEKRPKADEHWKTVVRDAFIDGRDDDAIDLLLSNIVTWIAASAESSKKRRALKRSSSDFPAQIFVVWSDEDDPEERIMLVEEDIDSISIGAAVAVYHRNTIQTKRVVKTLE